MIKAVPARTSEASGPSTAQASPDKTRPAPTRDETPNKLCPECGRGLWAARLSEFGAIWNCPDCCLSVDEVGTVYQWREPLRPQPAVAETKEEKYRGNEPCPRCGQGLWVVEVPNYGSRKQCDNCRITIMFGNAILEWGR